MMALLYSYVLSFLHPFKNQKGLHELRMRGEELAGVRSLRLAEGDQVPTALELEEKSVLKFEEILGVSWFFAVIEGFYAILTIHMGQVFFQNLSSPNEIALFLPVDTAMYTQRALLTAALAKVTFFPIVFWAYSKLWKILIQFFANLFQVDGNLNKMTDQVVNQSMTSDLMLAIPIFGRMLRHLFGLVHIFAGLRENMRMSVLQSVVVILSPAVIMTMISSFTMVTILYLVSLTF